MKFGDLLPGDRVNHVNLGPGKVMKITDTHVFVAYEREHGGEFGGIYDRDWFRINPGLLSLRP